MSRKLSNPGFVTTAGFARKLGVSWPAVGKAIRTGRLVAYDGHGDRVPPGYTGRKWLKPDLALEDWHNRRLRFDDPAADDIANLIAAARAELEHDEN